jgi:hypothetical protein
MRPKSADEIVGLEFDWLASDADGHVAIFSTAGGGFAPPEFLRDTEAHDVAIDAVLASTPITQARHAPQLPPGVENTWRLVAERGLFAFDADPHGGPYRLVAAPKDAIHIADLPDAAVAVATQLVYPNLKFGDLQEVSSDMLERRR